MKQEPKPLNIACEKCGAMLLDPTPGRMLASKPPKKNAVCPGCNWKGYVRP